MNKPKIMLVTSDAALAKIAKTELGKAVALTCLSSGEKALEVLDAEDDYMAVLAGLNLSGMDGLKLLAEVRREHPRLMRLLITADTNFKTAANAVNMGHISRLLPRPCPPKALKAAIKEAVQKYRKGQAENEAMKDTLFGTVRMLVDILELVQPDAVMRSKRIRRRAQRVCTALKAMPAQLMDMVVLLSNIGCVALPPEILEKMESGKRPSKEDMQIFYTHPSIAAALLENVPRMDKVAEIIRHQNTPVSQNPPMGARILKACIDMDRMELTGASPEKAVDFMASKPKIYDAKVVDVLKRHLEASKKIECHGLNVADLEPGMVMQRDMVTSKGAILLPKGETLSEASHLRLQAFSDLLKVVEPVCVEPPAGAKTD